MSKCKKVNKQAFIGIVMAVVLCVACSSGEEPESVYEEEAAQDALSDCAIEPESACGEGSDQNDVNGFRQVSPQQ